MHESSAVLGRFVVPQGRTVAEVRYALCVCAFPAGSIALNAFHDRLAPDHMNLLLILYQLSLHEASTCSLGQSNMGCRTQTCMLKARGTGGT